jgi:ABC-type sugar transport system ATPase subunit
MTDDVRAIRRQLLTDIITEAKDRGVPVWLVVSEMREVCETEDETLLIDLLEQTIRGKYGDAPGWGD